MNNLIEITDSIITASFPELIDEDIQIEYTSIDDVVMQSGYLSPEGFYIEVDNNVQDAPVDVIEGGVAHELSHIAEYLKESRFHSMRNGIAYRISSRYKRLVERNTDVDTIMRGYGHQLLAFLQYCEQKGFPHYHEDGLSIREVNKLLSSGQ